MAEGTVHPESDDNINWTNPVAPDEHWDEIDDWDPPMTIDFTQAGQTPGDDNEVDDFNMTTLGSVASVSQIVVYAYGMIALEGGTPEVDIWWNGDWVGEGDLSPAWNGIFSWSTKTFAGLVGGQTELDALKVRIRADVTPSKSVNNLASLYCMVTYEEGVAGYTHDFLGIPAANIDSIMGIPTANIDNICGL